MSKLPNGWIETTLGKIIKIKYGKDHQHLAEGKYPLYGSGGIMRYVENFLYTSESILIPRKGTLTNLFYVNKPFWSVDTIFYTEIDSDEVIPKFLFYKLSTINLAGLNVGSAVPSLTTKVLNPLELEIPPLPEQKAIADVLSSLDEKIELLQEENKTLEELAQTMFKEWFVNNEDSKQWKIRKLKELVTVVDNRGKTPPIVEEKTKFPLIEVNALDSKLRLINYNVIKKYVDEETYKTWFRNSLNKYDTILATVGTLGNFSMFLTESGNIAQNLIGISPIDISPFYIYQILKYRRIEILKLDIGGVQPSIKVPHLLLLNIEIPPINLSNKFDSIIKPIVEKLELNYSQIQTLSETRNILLPKLMSGEIRVEGFGE